MWSYICILRVLGKHKMASIRKRRRYSAVPGCLYLTGVSFVNVAILPESGVARF
jgi:hypothetical protein